LVDPLIMVGDCSELGMEMFVTLSKDHDLIEPASDPTTVAFEDPDCKLGERNVAWLDLMSLVPFELLLSVMLHKSFVPDETKDLTRKLCWIWFFQSTLPRPTYTSSLLACYHHLALPTMRLTLLTRGLHLLTSISR
jgi:hypothetical protein